MFPIAVINQSKVQIALQQAMQFGHALQCIIESIVYANPRYGAVWMIKIDLADGYYCISWSTQGSLNLAVILPTMTDTNDILIAMPSMLPLGWSESPPYFCMCTEMVADVTDQQLAAHKAVPVQPHPQELQVDCNQRASASMGSLMAQWSIPYMHRHPFPVAQADIYLDDSLA